MKIGVLVALMACAEFVGIEGALAQLAFKWAPPGTVVEYSNKQITTWVGPEGNSYRQAVIMRDGRELMKRMLIRYRFSQCAWQFNHCHGHV